MTMSTPSTLIIQPFSLYGEKKKPAARVRIPSARMSGQNDWFGFALVAQQDRDFRHGGYRLALDDEARDLIRLKWPTRGDSILLDCLTLDDDRS